MRKTERLLLVLVLLIPASAVVGARPAAAAQESFAYTGATQQWIVPAGVTSATFHVFGASGGPNSASSIGGNGGEAEATIAVTPGETIEINVGRAGLIPVGPSGGLGGDSPGGGYGGAGGDSFGPMSHGGGNGGGSSDIRQGGTTLAHRVLVGGGGGGAGGTSADGGGALATGGDGGDTGVNGAAGLNDPDNTSPGVTWEGGCGGGAASTSAGGAAGEQIINVCGLQGVFGAVGQLGHGGNGGDIGGPAGGGGGGGGGYYGGGGGGSGGSDLGVASGGGGGGGGSNFGPAGAVLKSGVNLGNGSVLIVYDALAATATPTPVLTPVAKSNCDAGKAKCVSTKQACLSKVHSSSEKQGEPPDPADLQKCKDKFDGGTKGVAAGCIGKLESKQDPKKPKTICSATGDLAALEDKVDTFVTDVVSAIDPGFPVVGSPSKCDAGKITCVWKKASCLIKAHQAGAKQGAPPDSAQLQKCRDKFDGGAKGVAAGCIGKLESKQDPTKPKTICATTGNLLALEDEVDAFVVDVVSAIRNTP